MPISTKLGTKHPWVKRIKGFFLNEGPCPFPRGDIFKIVKIHWQNLEIFFSRTTWLISNKFGTKCLWVQETQDFTNKKTFNSQKGDNVFFSPNQHYDLIIALLKCVYWFELFKGEWCGPWASCNILSVCYLMLSQKSILLFPYLSDFFQFIKG